MAVPFEVLCRQNSSLAFLSSALVAFFYQYLLSYWKFNNYIMSLKRDSFLDMNKEGIFSTIGYLSLYLGGYGVYRRLSEIFNAKSK